jgi:hypothetical protein
MMIHGPAILGPFFFVFVFWWPIVTGKVTPLQQKQQQQ